MFKKLDLWLIIPIIILSIFSVLILGGMAIGNQNLTILYKQLGFVLISFLVMFIFSKIDYRIYKNNPIILNIIYIIFTGLLVSLLIFGQTTRGIKGWLNLGFFSIQPVEFMKIILILVLSKYFSTRNVFLWNFKHIFISGIYTLIPCLLVLAQPDLGAAVILFIIWIAMISVSGIKIKHLSLIFGSLLLVSIFSFVFLLKPYQKERITAFINPALDARGINYNAKQSMIAIGSGRIFGKGLSFGTQTQLNFLPESKTDFVFASIAEEIGLVGMIIVFTSFVAILYKLFFYLTKTSDNFAFLLIFGLMIKISAETIINIGVNVGFFPVVGIALPFLSMGGSHLLADFILLGIVLNTQKKN
jgi:rod shape determining protein RodA